MAPVRRPRKELFLSKIDKTDPSGCWRWKGKISKRGRGYGDFAWNDPVLKKPVTEPAHRVAYKLFVGEIPEGYHIDHVWPQCIYTDCVRPDHLEAVTPAENTRRYLLSKTQCRAGHLYSEFGYQGTTGMRCRECERIRSRAHYWRNHDKDAPKAPLKTHCKNEHEFTEENTRIREDGARLCKQCARDATDRWKAKQRSLPST